jgi:hypothetical protein
VLIVLRAAARAFLAALLGASAACGPPPAPTASAPPVLATAAAPTAGRSPAPATATTAELAIEDLPLVEPDPETLTAICDPDPDQVDPDAGETTMFCFDGLVLGLRAVRAATASTSRRAYLVRAPCPGTHCPTASLGTATVVVWTDTGTFLVRLDSAVDTVSFPELLVVDPWPVAGPLASPAAKREALAGAPAIVATRTPYPYCGRSSNDAPVEVLRCFRDSVLLGRPVEAIQQSFGIEGDEVIDLYRFDGAGAISRYERSGNRWFQQQGTMILGPRAGTWSFDPWDEGDVVN